MSDSIGVDNKHWKESFDSKLSHESFLVPVLSAEKLQAQSGKIFDLLNRYGVAIVGFLAEETPQEQLLCFKSLFGDSLYHDRSDSDGIAEVAAVDESSPYPGVSSRAYTFHTDGTYDRKPPPIVALRCHIPARQGGVTQLASAKAIYDFLALSDLTALNALFEENALTIKRAGKAFSGPIFWNSLDSQVAMRYRADNAAHPSDDNAVRRGVDLIETFLSKETNLISFRLEARQVLITDNFAVLHARTAFEPNDPRLMHRLWFNGVPPSIGKLHLGFSKNGD